MHIHRRSVTSRASIQSVAAKRLAVVASSVTLCTLALSACGTPSGTAAGVPSSPGSSATTSCIPPEVLTAGIPIVNGNAVCDLVRGSLASNDLSIVVKVASVSAGFADARAGLEAAGYSAGVTSASGSNYSNGTYSVLLTVDEEAPYGAVATYAISRS